MPEDRVPAEQPKVAGKFLSYLVASAHDTNTIEVDNEDGLVYSSDTELQQFLTVVEEAKESSALVSQCKSILFQRSESQTLGTLGCMQQGWFYSFTVLEHSPLPNLKWEFRRTLREVGEAAQGEPDA
jgi:hypothetical protein